MLRDTSIPMPYLYPSASLQTTHIFVSACRSSFCRDTVVHLPQCCPHSKRLSCHSTLWSLPRTAIINYHKLGGLEDRNVFSCNSMGQKSEIKMSAGSGSLLRGDPFLPFQLPVAPNTPWPKTALIPYLPMSSHSSLSSISYKDIYH